MRIGIRPLGESDLRAAERNYRDLIDRATNIEEILSVQGRLDVSATVVSTTEDEHQRTYTPLAVAYIDFSPPHTTVVILDGESGDEERDTCPEASVVMVHGVPPVGAGW